MRIFLDANILFSAAKSDGAVRGLLDRLRKAGHALCADHYVITEARRNLEAKSGALRRWMPCSGMSKSCRFGVMNCPHN